MPALRKPHRIAFLLPEVAIEGADVAHAHEVALLLWTACIEVCQRHPGLAVYDAESLPLVPAEGHFRPQHATLGATPGDAFWGTTRRDELVWLEVGLPKAGRVRLHTLDRAGARQAFDALGKNLGEQIQQVLAAWLVARGLGALPRRFELVSAEEVIATVRVIAPVLVEQARAWALPTAPAWSITPDEDVAADDVPDAVPAGAAEDVAGAIDLALVTFDEEMAPPPVTLPAPVVPVAVVARARVARPVANRVPASGLRLAAVRLLALALREDLDDLILALDPAQPQALFARVRAASGGGPVDFARLRQVIAAAPCWARPYAELRGGADAPEDTPVAPTELESVAGAGIAALCRPQHQDVIERVATRLEDAGLGDEGVRLLERAQGTHEADSRAHIALVELARTTGREGRSLERALRAARLHGCPMDPGLPWYPDQIQVDLLVADALMRVGRIDEAIALRANRLEGREATWPRHTRVLAAWRTDPRYVAWGYAREGAFRGDPARAVEGFGRIEPASDVDVALLLDALVAMGREEDVPLAWAQYGRGAGHTGPVARLAAARCLMAAGEWRRGLEELWRVELTEPGRDEHVAIARCGLLLSGAPLEVAELALGERLVAGATSLARRMARDIADFVPGAAASSMVTRALGKLTTVEFDPASLGGFAPTTRSRRAIDALFAELGPVAGPAAATDALSRCDRLVNRWLEVVFSEASEEDPVALAQAAAYTAGQAVGRYLAATTVPANPIAGGLRVVAGEALALVRRHRTALGDREARALCGVLEPLLRRVDRWLGSAWLGTVERSCALDERARGDVAGFVDAHGTVAARILGPEESAVLAASIARLHRERPSNWAAAVSAQAMQLAHHTGYLGADEWADATAAQLAAGEIEPADAIDALHTAAYLVEGISAGPAIHAARVLLGARRGPAALGVLVVGLGAARPGWRDAQLATLADAWASVLVDTPLAFDQVAAAMYLALQAGEPARAEKLGRWAVALDPTNAEAHRNLGLALAHQGKTAEALVHLTRGTRAQATQILAGVLYQTGALPRAMAVLDYASRWYVRADQWLTFGGIAYAAMDNPRTVKAYALAYELDPAAFDASQLNAYAGVLDEVGDAATTEQIAEHLLRIAADDLTFRTSAWNHLACARLRQGRFDEAARLAADAVAQNPLPDNAAAFAATLERARAHTAAPPPPPPVATAEPVFALLATGEHAAAAAYLHDPSWRVRRAALTAARFRFGSESEVEVTSRAYAAALAVLASTTGLEEREAMIARALALQIREQAHFARDPVPRLGDRMTREAFHQAFRARGGIVLGEPAAPPRAFEDRVVVPGSKLERISDYVALLRDLAALAPGEALAQFDLDEASYVEVGAAWGAALEADPALAGVVAAGLARR